MAGKFPLSGYNDEAFTAPATDVREMITSADFDGRNRIFWLRGFIVANEHATQVSVYEFYDQNEAAATAANQRGTVILPANASTHVDLTAPGFKFVTNLTAGITNGTVNIGGVTTWGYEEG